MPDPFRKVRLGRTRLEITQFGLGSAALGWLYTPVSRAGAQATVRRAYELGCNFFDTSPLYGNGLAEARLGTVLPELPRANFVLSDKIGYAVEPDAPLPDENSALEPARPGYDFSYDSAFRFVEGSLKRLG